MGSLLIGEVGRRSGANPQTIRYYERLGLLTPPSRTPAGYRRYDERSLDELLFIKAARSIGFSLKEIKQMLDVVRDGPAGCSPVLEIARSRMSEIDVLIRSFKQKRKALEAAIDRCGTGQCTLTLSRLARDVMSGRRSDPS